MIPAAVFLISMVGAWLWSMWGLAVAQRRALVAANADGALHLLSGATVLAIARGAWWYVVVSAAGAWLGTFLAVRT